MALYSVAQMTWFAASLRESTGEVCSVDCEAVNSSLGAHSNPPFRTRRTPEGSTTSVAGAVKRSSATPGPLRISRFGWFFQQNYGTLSAPSFLPFQA